MMIENTLKHTHTHKQNEQKSHIDHFQQKKKIAHNIWHDAIKQIAHFFFLSCSLKSHIGWFLHKRTDFYFY